MSKYARRVDNNQSEMVKIWRQYGISVEITSSVGKKCADVFVAWQGRTIRVEIKNPLTKGKLSAGQNEAFLLWRGEKIVAYYAEDVLLVFGIIKQAIHS